MEEEGEGAGDADGVQPDEDDLHLGVGAGAAVLARELGVRAEEAVEVRHDIATDGEGAEEEGEEDDLDDVVGVLHRIGRWFREEYITCCVPWAQRAGIADFSLFLLRIADF